MKDIDLQAERAAFEAWFEPYWNGPQSDLAAWSGWKARAAVEADRAQRVPDGYDQGSAECMAAVQEILDGKDRGDGVANEPWESIRRRLIALVAPAPAQQECWCEKCDLAQGNPLGRTRMSLCPECGDKRCPRAKHHDNACAQHQEQPQQERGPTLPPGHCASDWGGRPTGPCLYTDDEVMEILAAHGIKE